MPKVLMTSPSIRYFYPWPLTLVTTVDEAGKPNIITIGASSICSARPPVVGVAIGIRQYSLQLLRATGDFGVNLPDRSQLQVSDYCGTVSGRDLNKFEKAGLTVQPAAHIHSPLIAECPVSLECKVVQIASLGSHDGVMGEIIAVHVDDRYLQGEELDSANLDPILCYWGEYWTIGDKLGEWGKAHESMGTHILSND